MLGLGVGVTGPDGVLAPAGLAAEGLAGDVLAPGALPVGLAVGLLAAPALGGLDVGWLAAPALSCAGRRLAG